MARSKDLKSGKLLVVAFAGEPIVLVRTVSGLLYALEDRCAHRQVPLKAGQVTGDLLQCGYHCWTYDKTGRCVSIPYLDKDKKVRNGVRSYPCHEAYGLIFVYPGDIESLSEATFPDIPSFFNGRYKTRFLNRQVKCHYSFMHENLMDMNHQFLQRRLMGRIRSTLLDTRKGNGWIEADYTFTRAGGRQPIDEKIMLGRRAEPTAARTGTRKYFPSFRIFAMSS